MHLQIYPNIQAPFEYGGNDNFGLLRNSPDDGKMRKLSFLIPERCNRTLIDGK